MYILRVIQGAREMAQQWKGLGFGSVPTSGCSTAYNSSTGHLMPSTAFCVHCMHMCIHTWTHTHNEK